MIAIDPDLMALYLKDPDAAMDRFEVARPWPDLVELTVNRDFEALLGQKEFFATLTL
jgi:hypothetical protein